MKTRQCPRHLPRFALLLIVAGCTVMRPADDTAAASEHKVEVGDTVRIVTHAGQQIELDLTEIDRDTLTGIRRNRAGDAVTGYEIDPADQDSTEETLRVPFDDVETAQVHEVDGWKIAAVAGGTFAVLWLVDLLLVTFVVALAF